MPDAEDRARGIVIDCPECRRTIWSGTTCTHGQVPPPAEPVGGPEVDPPAKPTPKERRRGK